MKQMIQSILLLLIPLVMKRLYKRVKNSIISSRLATLFTSIGKS